MAQATLTGGVGINYSTYLCCFCNQMFEAAENSIDRTRQVRCPKCAIDEDADRLMGARGI